MNNRLIKLRNDILKLSQNEFGDKIGKGQSTIAGYENGTIQLKKKTIEDICEKFNVNEEWLRSGTGEIFKEMTEQDLIKQKIDNQLKDGDEFTKKVLYQIASLTPEEWKAIEEFIYKIKK